MPLTPKQILQHMEVPPLPPEHPWSGTSGLYVLGSLEPSRMSLSAQQVRALNLIYALTCENRVRQGTKIAIVGAGPAGLTASRAAAHLGAEVRVFERSERPMSVFCPDGRGNARRFVHPRGERWPEEGWANEKADLPFLDWSAGTPQDVAGKIAEELRTFEPDQSRNQRNIDFYVNGQIEIRTSSDCQWTIQFKAVKWNWTDWSTQNDLPPKQPLPDSWTCDLLILAIGFGVDVPEGSPKRGLGYWQDDSVQWNGISKLKGNATVLVSGDGDGALIDAINACFVSEVEPCPHRSLIERIKSNMAAKLRASLLKMEQSAKLENWSPERLWFEYEKIARSNAEALRQFDRTINIPDPRQRRVVLATQRTYPLRPDTFAINRFIVWRLLKRRVIEHTKGRLPNEFSEYQPKGISVDLLEDSSSKTRGSKIQVHNVYAVIPRHGPSHALRWEYPEIWNVCREKLLPRNELDQTRDPCWPLNFFIAKPGTGVSSGIQDVTGKPVTVPLTTIYLDRVKFRLKFSPSESDPRSPWTKLSGTIDLFFRNEKHEDLSMEHQLTPTPPFRLRLANPESDQTVKRRKIHGDPSWAVAYKIPAANKKVTVRLEGDPCGSVWIPDAVGLPIYSDMRVANFEMQISFEKILPFIVVEGNRKIGAVNIYGIPLRRLSYEDGEGSTPPGTKTYHKLRRAGASASAIIKWKAKQLPSGYFVGVEWDGMVPKS